MENFEFQDGKNSNFLILGESSVFKFQCVYHFDQFRDQIDELGFTVIPK